MKKFILFVLILLQTTPSAYPDSCSNLYSKLSNQLKIVIPTLTWVDVNPINSSNCQFIIRYFPYNETTQQQINALLPSTIQSVSKQCIWLSQGKHIQTEGYGTLNNVLAQCQ